MSALEGVRVIDLTEALAGPYCTMVLGDLGADVIKIERPEVGDQSRKWGPPFIGTESAYFLSVNRNKRSIELDIKSEDGREKLRCLVNQADVFICNVRKLDSLREAGLDPETVCASNPRLVYCSITAYGRTGPYANRGGYDLVAQGEAGLMEATGEVDGEPMRWPVAIADLSCGLWAANAILAALYVVERTGQGQFIDQALLDSQLSWASVMAGQYFADEKRPPRLGNRHANIVPYQVFKARDKYLIVAVGTQGHWHRFCQALELGHAVRDDPQFATNGDRLRNRAQLCARLEAKFAQNAAEFWLERLRAADIPCGPVNALDDALKDPQVQHRGMIVDFEHPMGRVRALGSPIHLEGTPTTFRRRPPLLGEHTEEILEEIGDRCRPRTSAPSGVHAAAPVRAPRYATEIALQLQMRNDFVAATIRNVSAGGCRVQWVGLPSHVGDRVTLLMADDATREPTEAIVRWVSQVGGAEQVAGLEVLCDGTTLSQWNLLVANLVRSGACAA